MKMRCLIVDDEPLAIEALFSLLERLETVEIIAKCRDAIEAFQVLQERKVDLIFLDIEMPEMTGLSFLKTLKNPPCVILTTAYRDYAVEAFELDVIDYLLKPISFDRLLKSLDKVKQHHLPTLSPLNSPDKEDQQVLFVKTDKMQLKLKFEDILYIEGLKDYIQIHTEKEVIVTKLTMKRAETLLPVDRFLRIHQSYIVSMIRMTGFSPTSIFINKRELPIGRKYKGAVHKRLESLSIPRRSDLQI